MKKFLFLLLFLFLNSLLFTQTGDDAQSIAIQPPFLNVSPNGTQSFADITNGFDNIRLGTDFGEPYIATNPRDLSNSICAFNTNNLYYTLDGFKWTKNNPVFIGFSVLGDPVMTYDSLGNCYYVQLYQNGSTYGVAVIKSTNKGVSWVGPYNVYSTTAGLSDKEWVSADQTGGPFSNNIYIAWRQFGASGMRFVRSTDLGVTWSAPLTFSGSQGAFVTVGPNGNVQGGSVYFACNAGGGIYVNRSTDGGVTFSAQVVAATVPSPGNPCAGRQTVKNCIRMNDFPHMAADNGYTSTRGNVYAVYCGNPVGPDVADVYLVRSTDFGVTWSSPLRINDDATITDQWMPSVSVDKVTGKIFVCWFDSRVDVAANLMTRLYGATSTNGGVSFTPNANISDVSFNPNSMAVGQPGGHNYIGDYIGIAAIRNTSYAVWMDGRANNLGSFVGYYPDFAMTVSPTTRNMVNNDSVNISVVVPAIKGPFSENVKFTAALDTLPQSGTIQITFNNGKDSITSIPDSVIVKVKTIGNVTPKLYKLNITGRASATGLPVHIRTVDLLVNTSVLTIGTNRNGVCDFRVNAVQYNTIQNLIFANSSVVTVQAISPKTVGFNRYVFVNWSDNGDTTHNITINGNFTLIANYKAQYRLAVNSIVGNSFGDNYYDSNSTVTFGVLSRQIIFNGTLYTFRGWNGSGTGSYTSPDSTGNDTAVTVTLSNPISETARWTAPIGIQNIGTEIPKVYKLYQNYPNPFNPKTIINFDIIKEGNVKITLYDILGKEVDVILNQSLQPGKYRADFSAEGFASGLYFYKIVAGDFVDIRKMIVIK